MKDQVAFQQALSKRIKYLRKRLVLDNTQLDGMRYNDDVTVIRTILGCMEACRDKSTYDIPLHPYMFALKQDAKLVKEGRFDEIIYLVLDKLAALDYQFETDTEFN